jgi:hypothetical protein
VAGVPYYRSNYICPVVYSAYCNLLVKNRMTGTHCIFAIIFVLAVLPIIIGHHFPNVMGSFYKDKK